MWGVLFGVDPSCWGLQTAESEKVRLISREIIFQEFEPMTTIPQRYRRTDGQIDGPTCLGTTERSFLAVMRRAV